MPRMKFRKVVVSLRSCFADFRAILVVKVKEYPGIERRGVSSIFDNPHDLSVMRSGFDPKPVTK